MVARVRINARGCAAGARGKPWFRKDDAYGNCKLSMDKNVDRSDDQDSLRERTSMISMVDPRLRIWGSGVRISSGAPFCFEISTIERSHGPVVPIAFP
jgi:hypothetical protein